MFNKRRQPGNRYARTLQTQRARTVAPWRIWTALLTVISFVVLVSTATMHHHATAVEDQDCAICSVVTHKVADLPPVTMPAMVAILLSYAPFLPAKPSTARPSPLHLPPSCGPPAPTSTIC